MVEQKPIIFYCASRHVLSVHTRALTIVQHTSQCKGLGDDNNFYFTLNLIVGRFAVVLWLILSRVGCDYRRGSD
jgi:hypothetical protein